MNTDEKAAALNALADISVRIRKPGDWYVHQSTEIKDDGMLHGTYGNGKTPQAAIENHWRILTEVQPPKYIVANASSSLRKAVRWNGYMWSPVPEDRSDSEGSKND